MKKISLAIAATVMFLLPVVVATPAQAAPAGPRHMNPITTPHG